MKISKMSFVSKAPFTERVSQAAKPFEALDPMFDRKSAEEAKFENDDINTEILEGLSLCVKEQFLSNDRLGLGRNRAIERYGNAAPLDEQVAAEA